MIQQQQQIANAAVQLEKSRLLPDLSFGYNNTSIKGIGADDKYYSSSKRFNAVQVGIGIPIFAKAQRSKINSAKINQELAINNYAAGLQMLQSEYNIALAQYKKYTQSIQYFENTALKNAIIIANTANTQLVNGNINYLEWVQLINQVTTVKSEYVEAVKNLNDSILQLNYFTNQ
jgi:cobalt-zinc-cadmium resistance protein CzcA